MATKEEKQNFQELLSWIEDGWYDNFIPQIIDALKARQTDTLEVGSTVIVKVGESNSKYNIDGSEAVVLKVNAKSVKVKLTKLSALAQRNGIASIGGVWNLSPTFVVAK
jgi:hypothetical protein